MKSFTQKVLVFVMGLSSFGGVYASPVIDPEGGHVGGGDKRCGEFYDIATNIALSLVKTGQAKIDEVNPLIRADEVWKVIKKLKVVPAKDLPRQALSDPDKIETQLDVLQWDRISTRMGKVRLVAHELMILTEAETEGLYLVSQDIIPIFLASKNSLLLKSASFQKNVDGSVIIYRPRYLRVGNHEENDESFFISNASSNTGVCRYLGFSEEINSEHMLPSREESFVYLDRMGRQERSDRAQNYYFIGSITCK